MTHSVFGSSVRSSSVFGEDGAEISLGGCRDKFEVSDEGVSEGRTALAGTRGRHRLHGLAENALSIFGVLVERRHDLRASDGFMLRMPAIVVGNHGDRCIAELRFARELGFGDISHADDDETQPAMHVRFGERRKLRAFDADVRAAAVNGNRGMDASVSEGCGNLSAGRLVERDVRNEAAAEKSGSTVFGAVDELVHYHEFSRTQLLLERTDGADGNDALDTQNFQRVDVRAEVDFGGQDAMPAAMAREESDALPLKQAEHDGVRGIAERRLNANFPGVGQAGHGIKSAASDDAYRGGGSSFHTFCVFLFSSSHSDLRMSLPVQAEGTDFDFVALFVERGGGNIRIMAEDDDPAVGHNVAHPLAFGLERLHGIEIVSHDPGKRNMMPRGQKIRNKNDGLAAAGEFDGLNVGVVAGDALDGDAGKNAAASLQHAPLSRFADGEHVLREIAGTVALGWMKSMLDLGAVNVVFGVGKRGNRDAVGQPRAAAGVIKVEMRVDHDVDLRGRDALCLQRGSERITGFHGVYVAELVAPLCAVAGLNQDRLTVSAHEKRVAAEGAAVAFVGRHFLVPERFRNNAEHGASVKAESAAAHKTDVHISKEHSRAFR